MASEAGSSTQLLALFQALARARQARGAIDFETTETQMMFDANGKIERIERHRCHGFLSPHPNSGTGRPALNRHSPAIRRKRSTAPAHSDRITLPFA